MIFHLSFIINFIHSHLNFPQDEIAPIEVKVKRATVQMDADEHPKPKVSLCLPRQSHLVTHTWSLTPGQSHLVTLTLGLANLPISM